jgi:hypothetical protein
MTETLARPVAPAAEERARVDQILKGARPVALNEKRGLGVGSTSACRS